tara:strand:+ start:587 stop:1228 length:642 start_codon:yes stop_codon:yes gene_type:complete
MMGGLDLAMSFRERLAKRERNKRRIADALKKLPKAPPQVGLLGKLYNTLREVPEPLLDASSISFQNEALLRLAAGQELANQNNQVINPRKIIQDLQPAGLTPESIMQLVEAAEDEELLDDELVSELIKEIQTSPVLQTGRQVIRSSRQFDTQNLLPRFETKTKRTRKRTQTDKNMSKALRKANDKFRKKNGQLRKGATQAQIMRYAHKLLRKM